MIGGKESRVDKSQRGEKGLICECEGHGKRCKSKAGLTIHQKRMHREGYLRCGEKMTTEGARASHDRSCMGGAVEVGETGRS